MSDDPPFPVQFPAQSSIPDQIVMAHGGGGRISRDLVSGVFKKHFQGSELARDHDGAYLRVGDRLIAYTTDSYVVSPPFFPGGDIGSLAVHGTVNDLAACGAKARWMSAGFILEEGFPIARLEQIVASMAAAASGAGIELVTGDTKVVERGRGDGIYIAMSGVGEVLAEPVPDPRRAQPGDAVIVNGPIGLHGMAVMSVREGLPYMSRIQSDSAPLGGLVESVYQAGIRPHCLRDATRGGLAATLSEIAIASGTGMILDAEAIPIPRPVQAACELLGLDPLHVANEGKMLFIVDPADAARTLAVLRTFQNGREAAIIGHVRPDEPGHIVVQTAAGGSSVLDIPAGDSLPRIC